MIERASIVWIASAVAAWEPKVPEWLLSSSFIFSFQYPLTPIILFHLLLSYSTKMTPYRFCLEADQKGYTNKVEVYTYLILCVLFCCQLYNALGCKVALRNTDPFDRCLNVMDGSLCQPMGPGNEKKPLWKTMQEFLHSIIQAEGTSNVVFVSPPSIKHQTSSGNFYLMFAHRKYMEKTYI